MLETISLSCEPCSINFYRSRPDENSFYEYIQHFLKDNPNVKCAKGGHAAYGNAIHFIGGQRKMDGDKIFVLVAIFH